MDGKRHPSSFQQLEKLGEGTYATVSDTRTIFFATVSVLDCSLASKVLAR
jgi:hypothetical protein